MTRLQVVDESTAIAELPKDENGRVLPVVVKQRTLDQRRQLAIHAVYDAKPPERIVEELQNESMDTWSRVLARVDRQQNIKVDANVTAMGLLGLFPVAVEE